MRIDFGNGTGTRILCQKMGIDSRKRGSSTFIFGASNKRVWESARCARNKKFEGGPAKVHLKK